ncbi:hypothetical protein PH5382_03056 [Phaeobacter sp. CECT 5382]|nr:hypothetical protein PH5382_03056 [Phaeobacter sp. CECT 5382]
MSSAVKLHALELRGKLLEMLNVTKPALGAGLDISESSLKLVAGARFKRGLPDPEFPLTPAQAALVAGARRKRSLLHAAWDLSAVQRPKTEIDYDALLGLPSLTFP